MTYFGTDYGVTNTLREAAISDIVTMLPRGWQPTSASERDRQQASRIFDATIALLLPAVIASVEARRAP